jgi:hypothetical protein
MKVTISIDAAARTPNDSLRSTAVIAFVGIATVKARTYHQRLGMQFPPGFPINVLGGDKG